MASTTDETGTSDRTGDEKRRHQRYRVNKGARTKSADSSHDGSLMDISASGAAIEPSSELESGTAVEVDIEDFGTFAAHVTRTPDDDLFAVEFDMDEDEEDRLISELTQLHDDIGLEDS